MRWLIPFLLFLTLDLGVYAWLHHDLDVRLYRAADAVSFDLDSLGELQESILRQ